MVSDGTIPAFRLEGQLFFKRKDVEHTKEVVRERKISVPAPAIKWEDISAISDELLTLDRVLEELEVSRQELNRLVSDGKLPAFHSLQRIYFKKEDIETYKKAAEETKALVGFDEVLKELGVSENELRFMISDGTIPAFRLEGELFFKRSDIENIKKAERPTPLEISPVKQEEILAIAGEMLSFEDTIKELQIEGDELNRLISEGKLPAFRSQQRVYFVKEDLEAYRKIKEAKDLLTFEDVLKQLGVSENELKFMISDGAIPAFCLEGKLFFRRSDVESTKQKIKPAPETMPYIKEEEILAIAGDLLSYADTLKELEIGSDELNKLISAEKLVPFRSLQRVYFSKEEVEKIKQQRVPKVVRVEVPAPPREVVKEVIKEVVKEVPVKAKPVLFPLILGIVVAIGIGAVAGGFITAGFLAPPPQPPDEEIKPPDKKPPGKEPPKPPIFTPRAMLKLSILAQKVPPGTTAYFYDPEVVKNPQPISLIDIYPYRGKYILLLRKKGYEDIKIPVDLTGEVVKPDLAKVDIKFKPTKQLLNLYNKGKEALQNKNFDRAIENIQKVILLDPDFRDVKSLLASAQEGKANLQKMDNFEERVNGLISEGKLKDASKYLSKIKHLGKEANLQEIADKKVYKMNQKIKKIKKIRSLITQNLQKARLTEAKNALQKLRQLTPRDRNILSFEEKISQAQSAVDTVFKFCRLAEQNYPEKIADLIVSKKVAWEFEKQFRQFLMDAKFIKYTCVPQKIVFNQTNITIFATLNVQIFVEVDGKKLGKKSYRLGSTFLLIKEGREWKIKKFKVG
jgi:predicted site-specific integrase-resolvase/tetratricopeptide (TPR) repeat protein